MLVRLAWRVGLTYLRILLELTFTLSLCVRYKYFLLVYTWRERQEGLCEGGKALPPPSLQQASR